MQTLHPGPPPPLRVARSQQNKGKLTPLPLPSSSPWPETAHMFCVRVFCPWRRFDWLFEMLSLFLGGEGNGLVGEDCIRGQIWSGSRRVPVGEFVPLRREAV